MSSFAKARADYAVLLEDKSELHTKLVLAAQTMLATFMEERQIGEGAEIMATHRWALGDIASEKRCRVEAIRCNHGGIILHLRRLDSRGSPAQRIYQIAGDSSRWRKP